MSPNRPAVFYSLLGLILASLGEVHAGSFRALDFGPHAVNADGSVVVGSVGIGIFESLGEAIRWSADTGPVALGFLRGEHKKSPAWGVSADGSVVVGWSGTPGSTGVEAFRWTADSGLVSLGGLPGENSSEALAVSADGSVVVGRSGEAFRWTAADGMVGLGALSGSGSSKAYDVSADASVVVGRSRNEAFRWTAEGGMVSLGLVTGGFVADISVSADGSTVVGNASRDVYRWTAKTGAVDLGTLPALEPLEVYRNEVYGVSADGSLAVGTLLHISDRPWDDPVRAWIWDETHGMRDLQELLSNDFGIELPAWDLVAAADISDDGRVVVGWGWYTPPGVGPRPLGYRAVIPEPSACVLLSCALLSLLAYARQKRRRT